MSTYSNGCIQFTSAANPTKQKHHYFFFKLENENSQTVLNDGRNVTVDMVKLATFVAMLQSFFIFSHSAYLKTGQFISSIAQRVKVDAPIIVLLRKIIQELVWNIKTSKNWQTSKTRTRHISAGWSSFAFFVFTNVRGHSCRRVSTVVAIFTLSPFLSHRLSILNRLKIGWRMVKLRVKQVGQLFQISIPSRYLLLW